MKNTSPDTLLKLSGLTADQILAIPEQAPEWLYSNDEKALKHEYQHLAKIWYPERNKDKHAKDVFVRITALHDLAEKKIANGTWQIPGELTLTDLSGRQTTQHYVKKHSFALGDFYIDETSVTYVIEPEYKELYDSAVASIKAFPFADRNMQDQYQKFLPHIAKAFTAKEGLVLTVDKDPQLVSMQDLLDYSGGKVDPKHAAWMMSSLYDLSCYLSWAKETHNDISPDTVFVAPKAHYATLLGGWWYAAQTGEALTYLPDRTYDHAPSDVMREGVATPRVDLGLIRLTGRELLGHAKSSDLHLDKTIPAAFAEWLRMPTTGNPRDDYKTWFGKILPESFGARRYVELKTTFSDIYKKGEPSWAAPHP